MRLSYDGSPQKAEADESSRPQAGILSLPSLAQMLDVAFGDVSLSKNQASDPVGLEMSRLDTYGPVDRAFT